MSKFINGRIDINFFVLTFPGKSNSPQFLIVPEDSIVTLSLREWDKTSDFVLLSVSFTDRMIIVDAIQSDAILLSEKRIDHLQVGPLPSASGQGGRFE